MGAKKQTIGFRYMMSILSGICRGPINEFVEIKAGEKQAWTGRVTGNSLNMINKVALFGGETKEGGIQGPFGLFMGAEDQVLPGAMTIENFPAYGLTKGVSLTLPDVRTSIGAERLPEFRGVVTLWFSGLIAAMNPYVKEWRFRVRRWNAGWWQDNPWYPEKAAIILADGQIKAMNASHIVYECCTNPLWGRGLPASELDENSFIYAANTLCNEGFGLCIAWYRKEDIDVFLQKVCDLVGGVVYTDRESGLVTFRLIRDDYVKADLPHFTKTNGLVEVTEDDSGASDRAANEVIGTSVDPITNQPIQVRAQNLAAFQSQQSVSSLDQDYKGVPTKQLLARVVTRDMRANALGLKKYTLEMDRKAWRVAPGMPFRVSDPQKNINDVVMRAGEIDDGDMINGRITIKAVMDVFGLPDNTYLEFVESDWSPPGGDALPAYEERLIEAGYRDVLRVAGADQAQALAPDDAFIGQMAATPDGSSYQYDLATKAEGEPAYEVQNTGGFTGLAHLVANITAIQTTFEIADLREFGEDNVGEALMLDDEVLRLDAVDLDASTITVTRGVADTIPQPHLAGATVWTLDEDLVDDGRQYAEGETVNAKVLTRASSGILALEDADEQTVELIGRQGRPYPPANVKVDGVGIFASGVASLEPVITWVSRNRITQADQLVGHFDAAVAGEVGQTYTIRVYDAAHPTVVLRLVEGLTVFTWTYDAAMQVEDGDPEAVIFQLESVRDGITSWQHYNFYVSFSGGGWGFDWGFDWGGPDAP